MNAQCEGIAGNDNNTLNICDITNSSSKTIDLNVQLGTHTAGGTWKDDDKSGGLNITTGILNAQLIKRSGIYNYTYTVTDGSGCTDTAVVTVRIGGFSGIPGPDFSICNNAALNLFQLFKGLPVPSPQINGIWSDDTPSGGLIANTLDTSIPIPDNTYAYTYTVPSPIGSTCSPTVSSTVYVSILRGPEPGIPTNLFLCSNELVLYNNLNLNDQLVGEDSDGTWAEFGTSEISGVADSTIDLQNIYNTKGAGTYQFTYTVISKHPTVCDDRSSSVFITIEKQLDFTGATLVVNSDICEDEIATATYSAALTQGAQVMANGSYKVTYAISGVATPIVTIQNFVNGVLTFPIASQNFQQVNDYTVTILNIVNASGLGICTNIIGSISDVLHVYPLPRINSATLTIPPVCKGSDAAVHLSGNTNLNNDNYKIVYNLSGDNTALAKELTFSVMNGSADFAIPVNLIPNAGNTIISITKITNLTTGCTNTSTLSKNFVVKALPDISSLSMIINNVCQNQPVSVSLSGLGTLANVTLNYNLTGANTAINQTVTSSVSSGKADFIIPSASTNTGTTSLIITYIIDNGTGCGTPVINGTKSFTINTIPNVPIVNPEKFCKNDNKTIADLSPNGIQYQWFDSLTNTTILSANTLLVSGNYYVKEVNATTGCESGRAVANVLINEVQTPTLSPDGQIFCGLDKPTLQILTDNVTANGTLTWFDAPINGNEFVPTTLLKEGISYYGFDYSSSTDCYSSPLAVTVSLTNCDETPDFFVPDGFSPNVDTVNDTFRILNIEYIYPNYSLEIFNRYGNLMFTGNANKPEWDGKNSDPKIGIDGFAPNGVYFYVIHYNKGNKSPKQGRLYLSR